MSLFDLKSLVSKEDFADAHEPLNDGVKEVPNAQTVAASVKTGDVGKDTTSQGPAKVIPEKPDTDDQTKTEHNVVKESAEKSGGAPAAKPAPAEKDSGDNTESSAKPDESEKTDDETEETTQLEHNSEKSAKEDLEKTEQATKGLEAYAPNARKFDIIGHPKVKAENVSKMIGYLNRHAGINGTVTVSAESIDAAIAVGKNRVAKLEREVRILGKQHVSTEDATPAAKPAGTTTTTTTTTTTGQEDIDVVEEAIVTAEPTAHGSAPMDPAAAAALTETELDPLDVPMLEIQRVQETLDVLQTGAVAIEQYRQIAKANPKMSKQAAAVLQAGLEHIDQMCRLKVRSTGLESFLTTPRAAMEETEAVADKSFTDRAAEIGAKILKWIASLVEKAGEIWDQYKTGLTALRERAAELAKRKFNKEGTTVLKPAPAVLFMDGEFFGDWPTPDEEHLPTKLNQHYTKLTTEIKRRVGAMLRDKSAEDIVLVMEALRGDDSEFAELPGPHNIVSEAGRLKLGEGKANAPEEHSVENSEIQPDRLMNVTVKYLDALISLDIVKLLKASSNEVTQGLIKYRKGHGKDVDESEFQKVQQAVVDNSIKLFDVEDYFSILKYLGSICNARYKLCEQLAVKG